MDNILGSPVNFSTGALVTVSLHDARFDQVTHASFELRSRAMPVLMAIKAPVSSVGEAAAAGAQPSTVSCLFTQVWYLNNAYCIRSDNRCLLLFSRQPSYGLVCLCPLCSVASHCFSDLLLCGDVETNPDPRTINTRSGTNQNLTL